MPDFTKITHNESEINTIGLFLTNGSGSVPLIDNMTSKELLEFEGDTGIPNTFRVFRRLTPAERRINRNRFDSEDFSSIQLKIGTNLLVPNINLNREALFQADNVAIVATNYKAFLSAELARLLRDPGYRQEKDLGSLGNLTSVNTDVTVFMWLRSLSPEGDQSEGSWVNISAFIQNLDTSVGVNGGTFSITLPPVVCIPDDNGWSIDEDLIKNLNTGNIRDDYISVNSVQSADGNRSKFLFHTAVQENDIVFIRFERLALDAESNLLTAARNRANQGGISLSGSDVPGNTYDMIGLVDSNPISTTAANGDVTITIQGRDLAKVLIDDGTYFFPLQFAQGIFANNTDALNPSAGADKLFRRVLVDEVIAASSFVERSVSFSLKYIINQLSNTGLVPEGVFRPYGKRRSKRFRLKGARTLEADAQQEDEFEEKNQDGVYQIMKLIIDPSVSNRRIADMSLATAQGSILNSIRKVCQEPWVEFRTDTYGDQFYMIARKPPFDKVSLLGMVYDDVETDISVGTTKGDVNKSTPFPPGPDNISTIILDADVVITGTTRLDGLGKLSDLVLDINESDIINDSLDYHIEVYTWYMLESRGSLLGLAGDTNLAYYPAVSFPEYVNIWGSKLYRKVSNYIPFRPFGDKNQESRINLREAQGFSDLQFMVQSTQYLPFTREGTIVINGDRRFKRGLYCRLLSTNEIFYITGVRNIRSISTGSNDRVTVLEVERGMVEPYIKGSNEIINGVTQKVSYFNIINTDLGVETPTLVTSKDFLKNWRVNVPVFNFFLKRQQWKSSKTIISG